MKRGDGRLFNQLRNLKITPGFLSFAEGSVLIEMGNTRVICAVTLDEKVPPFLKNTGRGWVTAEYSMLPRSTLTRNQRESVQGKISGRSQEIQRLIGRSLRAVTDLGAFGERQLIVDCDVVQADGGTRTASITGAYVALYQAFSQMKSMGLIKNMPLKNAVAATSAGIVRSNMLLDLCYEEDSQAEVDFNVVMTDQGLFVEVQGTAENKPFSRDSLQNLINLAGEGINQLFEAQRQVIKTL
ncbi:MAG TPA: ribonuclease PH [Dehalococcoidales bacterium]|nr:ribonuclease PH [Dehalococcoidales bacterium]